MLEMLDYCAALVKINQEEGTDLWCSGREKMFEGVRSLKRMESRAQKGVGASCRIRAICSTENERQRIWVNIQAG